MRASRILQLFLIAAVLGLSVFGVMVWRATSVQPMQPADAEARFAAVRELLGPGEALLVVDEAGRLAGVSAPSTSARLETGPAGATPARTHELDQLRVLAWRAAGQRLITADVPFWFFALKEPAVRLVLRDTGLDLERLGVSPDDLRAHGPGLVLDHTRANGDRLLVWLE